MRTRRLFWLGAAVLLCVAALVAIVAVLSGNFGPTQGRILGTVGLLFACGSTVLAGRACVERRVSLPIAYLAIAVAPVAFVYWTVGVWSDYGDRLGRIAGIFAAWMVVLALATTLRLLLRSKRLWKLYAATVAGAGAAAAIATAMIARNSGSGWQGLVVLVILTAAGYFLVPILQRFTAADAAERPSERLLGSIDGADVLAVRGQAGHTVQIGSESVQLADDESVVVRRRA